MNIISKNTNKDIEEKKESAMKEKLNIALGIIEKTISDCENEPDTFKASYIINQGIKDAGKIIFNDFIGDI